MIIKRGNYEGASEFAHFDKPTTEMNLTECRELLDQILWQAMPSMDPDGRVYRVLERAEQCYREWRGL